MSFKIYKITNDAGLVYFGSTKLDLKTRYNRHKSVFKKFINNNDDIYCTSFEVLKGVNPRVELIEDLGNVTKTEARLKENNYITTSECVNSNRAILSAQDKQDYINDYREKNKQAYLAYQKKHYQDNKAYWKTDDFKQKQRAYYIKNKARIIERVKNHLKKQNEEQIIN